MKKIYESPELKVREFENEDVITTSGDAENFILPSMVLDFDEE